MAGERSTHRDLLFTMTCLLAQATTMGAVHTPTPTTRATRRRAKHDTEKELCRGLERLHAGPSTTQRNAVPPLRTRMVKIIWTFGPSFCSTRWFSLVFVSSTSCRMQRQGRSASCIGMQSVDTIQCTSLSRISGVWIPSIISFSTTGLWNWTWKPSVVREGLFPQPEF